MEYTQAYRIKMDPRKLRMLLFDRGMTQKTLSEISGVSRPTIVKIFGGGTCNVKSGEKICEALGVDIHEYATFNRF